MTVLNKGSKKDIVAGFLIIFAAFLLGMLLAYLKEYDGKELPSFINSILNLFLEEDFLPSINQLERHIKYTHIHSGIMGILCLIYGILLQWCSGNTSLKKGSILIIIGTIIVPTGFLLRIINPFFAYIIPFGTFAVTVSFICLLYEL